MLAPASPVTTDRAGRRNWPMDVRALYNADYARIYRKLYIEDPQWRDKHALNLRIIRSLLGPRSSWLDTCCGQAWHFSQVSGGGERTGIDISAAQLEVARRACPSARFIEADVLACDLAGARFDLVTNFWGSYSYLADLERIEAFLDRLIDWVAPGGALYLELITPETLSAFNETEFAARAGSRVIREDIGPGWSYQDPGGTHELLSPPRSFFRDRLAPWFGWVERRGTAATMEQLVAVDRAAEGNSR